MGGLHESFEDESTDVNRFLSTGFETGNGFSLGFGHIAHPTDSSGNFFKVERGAVDKFWLPVGEFFADRDEVGAGSAESDGGANLVGEVFQADDVIDGGDGGEAFGEVGGFRGKVGFD